MTHRDPLDEALTALGPSFRQEVRQLLNPVKDRFFKSQPGYDSSRPSEDGLHTPPLYMTDPELRKVAVELAELALSRGIDVNIPVEPNGRTFLHGCVLLRDSKIAVEAVGWLLAHGADPNRTADEGKTPLSLSMRLGREELSELMRSHGRKL